MLKQFVPGMSDLTKKNFLYAVGLLAATKTLLKRKEKTLLYAKKH